MPVSCRHSQVLLAMLVLADYRISQISVIRQLTVGHLLTLCLNELTVFPLVTDDFHIVVKTPDADNTLVAGVDFWTVDLAVVIQLLELMSIVIPKPDIIGEVAESVHRSCTHLKVGNAVEVPVILGDFTYAAFAPLNRVKR